MIVFSLTQAVQGQKVLFDTWNTVRIERRIIIVLNEVSSEMIYIPVKNAW